MSMVRCLAAWIAVLFAGPAAAKSTPPEWTQGFAPFHIAGPIWYVGTKGLAAYLIRTSQGAILIDGTMRENATLVKASLTKIGVPLRSVRYILVSHAHFDHAGADADLQAATGAVLVAGSADKAALESGHGPGEYASGEAVADFPPVKVDRAVRDGDRVTLSGVTLVAHATPGHTPGCTTWTTRVVDRGRTRDVVFPCSTSVAGNRLLGNRVYPGIVGDYRRSFTRLASMRADIVLPAHPEFADVIAREKRVAAGDADAFVAPGLLQAMTAQSRADFDKELARQQVQMRP